jgi:hypothetical protein
MTVYGTEGSTFVAELNRLANGGAAYPTRNAFLDAAGAANAWAGTTGLDTVGALNAKAGTTGLDLQGVCNELAGTTGVGPALALRQVAS